VLFERTVRLYPEHGASWGRLARAYFFTERDEAAWKAVHRAEMFGEPIPIQLRERLVSRSPEPMR
jgi:hypothetical protein